MQRREQRAGQRGKPLPPQIDLGVVAETAHHVAVMYAGRVVEYASADEIFDRPRHPYTIGLMRSLPDLAVAGERLTTIPGIVPSATNFPSGCRFRTRCPLATDLCTSDVPPLAPVDDVPAPPPSASSGKCPNIRKCTLFHKWACQKKQKCQFLENKNAGGPT